MVLSENSIPETTAAVSIHKNSNSAVAWIIGNGVLRAPQIYVAGIYHEEVPFHGTSNNKWG